MSIRESKGHFCQDCDARNASGLTALSAYRCHNCIEMALTRESVILYMGYSTQISSAILTLINYHQNYSKWKLY